MSVGKKKRKKWMRVWKREKRIDECLCRWYRREKIEKKIHKTYFLWLCFLLSVLCYQSVMTKVKVIVSSSSNLFLCMHNTIWFDVYNFIFLLSLSLLLLGLYIFKEKGMIPYDVIWYDTVQYHHHHHMRARRNKVYLLKLKKIWKFLSVVVIAAAAEAISISLSLYRHISFCLSFQPNEKYSLHLLYFYYVLCECPNSTTWLVLCELDIVLLRLAQHSSTIIICMFP